MPEGAVFFLSDAHFCVRDSEKEREKRRRLAAFVERIRGAERLYIVGDLFDFWFEYRRVIPRGFMDILYPLRGLVLAGTAVTLIGGNHDYWLGTYLQDEIGVELAPDGLRAEHQGRRFLIDHGDESLRKDRGYRALKKLLRQPAFIATARLLHPDFTYWAADRLAGGSRWLDQSERGRKRRERPLCLSSILDESFDCLILGHLHVGFHYLYRNWEILCLGDWIDRFSYARLSGGNLELLDDQGRSYPSEEVADPDVAPKDRILPEEA